MIPSFFGRQSRFPPSVFEGEFRGVGRVPSVSGWWIGLGLLALVVFLVLVVGTNIYTEWLWFDSLGFTQVYLTRLLSQAGLFVLGGVVALVVLLGNLLLAQRLAPSWVLPMLPAEDLREIQRWIRIALVGGALFLGLVFGSVASGQWENLLRFLNSTPFGTTDPIFGQDIGFYVFSLPFLRFLQSWAMGLLVLTLLGVGAIYGFAISLRGGILELVTPAIKAHLSAVGAGIVFLFAWSYWLDRFDLLYSTRGAVFGASFTDINAQIFALTLLTGLAALTGVLLLANLFLRGFFVPTLGFAVWILAAILASMAYPAFVQRFQVAPNELEKERPYIEHNISFTRQAYGLDRIQETPFDAKEAPSKADIDRNPETIRNVRLWDPRPLKDTYNQIQAIRLYYDFNDVDVDRYRIDGAYRQVMLSARELSPERLAAQAQTWVNQRLQFTHGYGVAMSLVSEVTPEGLPKLLVKDVPPVGVLPIQRPEVYYGEKSAQYVLVKTKQEEFDYPKGETNVYTQYQGVSGVRLDSPLRRFAYAWYFRDLNIIISELLTPESQILYRRQIRERVRQIAPFLRLDPDPYIVVADGKLTWLQDAYTTTDRYPYSAPHPERFNYIRNSVKVAISAYDGSVTFYVADPEDPLLQTYQRIFPVLFRPIEEMPPALRDHIRYPEGLFKVQAEMYRTYHMTDARVFYNREDVFNIPRVAAFQQEQPVEPYYVIMRLPQEQKEEFLLMLPFTPAGEKKNTIAWLAARSDGENYGKLIGYQLPKDRLIFGLSQIESRIDQDPTISGQFTLWSQAGSRLFRGNLLMIPIEDSFLYVQPLFLQAEKSSLPEMKRVILASGNRISMEPTLEESLAVVFGRAPTLPPAVTVPAPPPAGPQPPATLGSLARTAQKRFEQAQEYLRAGEWARYGEEIKALGQALKQLVELSPP